jgi:hypothetical protein
MHTSNRSGDCKRIALTISWQAVVASLPILFASAPLHCEPLPEWSIQVPLDRPVAFHGIANADNAGMGAGTMFYPAPSVAGLVAAMVTHGLIIEGVKQSQKTSLQAKADEVLAPYKAILDNWSERELTQRCLAKMASPKRSHESPQAPDTQWVVEGAPQFALTPDQTAIVLDNTVLLYRLGSRDKASSIAVRVISEATQDKDTLAYWSAGETPRLRDESAALLAESYEVALRELAAEKSGTQPLFKTVRYRQGDGEMIERAQILDERCGRMLLRTLRGALMSVPPRVRQDCTLAQPASAPTTP